MELELKILKSSKYTVKEKKYILIGVISKVLFDKNIFPKNNDLKEYVSLFENILNKKDPYRDYLYKSRTLLSSRVIKDLFFDVNNNFNIDSEYNIDKEYIKNLIEINNKFLEKKIIYDTKEVKSSKQETLLSNVINSKSKKTVKNNHEIF